MEINPNKSKKKAWISLDSFGRVVEWTPKVRHS
jgi:hypothetical protein